MHSQPQILYAPLPTLDIFQGRFILNNFLFGSFANYTRVLKIYTFATL